MKERLSEMICLSLCCIVSGCAPAGSAPVPAQAMQTTTTDGGQDGNPTGKNPSAPAPNATLVNVHSNDLLLRDIHPLDLLTDPRPAPPKLSLESLQGEWGVFFKGELITMTFQPPSHLSNVSPADGNCTLKGSGWDRLRAFRFTPKSGVNSDDKLTVYLVDESQPLTTLEVWLMDTDLLAVKGPSDTRVLGYNFDIVLLRMPDQSLAPSTPSSELRKVHFVDADEVAPRRVKSVNYFELPGVWTATSADGRLTLDLDDRSRIARLRFNPVTGDPVDSYCLWRPDYDLGLVAFDQQIVTFEVRPEMEAFGMMHGDNIMRIRGVLNLPGYACAIDTEFQRKATER